MPHHVNNFVLLNFSVYKENRDTHIEYPHLDMNDDEKDFSIIKLDLFLPNPKQVI